MTPEEFKQLEKLVNKLEGFLGKRYCILPSGTLGLPTLGVYDENGTMLAQEVGPSLEEAALRLRTALLALK